MVLNIFLILFDPFSTGKIEKLDFWDSSNSITLNINNYRTTSEKSINLDVIRKLIEYSLKMFFFVKAIFTLTVFEILLFKGRLVLSPTQRVTGSERVNVK